ncbi:MAG TPA: hypothetical protein VK474_09045 [Chthoniobacterales bacterium]|nr:hypothetical protein [Chthoniobacterales bacterium]
MNHLELLFEDLCKILRVQPITCGVEHVCCICGEDEYLCHHIDLDFRTAGYVCDDCAMPVKIAEFYLIHARLSTPINRCLDLL